MSTVERPGDFAGPPLPQMGSFATSEVLPLIAQAARELNYAREDRKRLRDLAAEAKAHAKRTRANLIVTLRVWGNDSTGAAIKTSAERQEWADADANVQQAELDADLAQTLAMNAGDALKHAEDYFSALSGMLAIERDELKAQRGAPHDN